MPLSWNEIRSRAIAFAKEWEHESSEDAEAKSFWDSFFNVFGISRRRVAAFEKPVKKDNGKQGYIDLLWKGVLIVEHKSRGKDLDKATTQVKEYFAGLRDNELPRYMLVSDFARFRLYDLDTDTHVEFALADFAQNVHLFGFMAGYEQRTYKDEDPVNIEAAELMGQLHDCLRAVGYDGHQLEVYLVRLLFCLFADDTAIFERGIFQEYIEQHTNEDGSDLAMHLAQLFQILNTPVENRFKNTPDAQKQFPYVNGKLFAEQLPIAAFDSQMRQMLLDACALDWGKISPAIFGSMFQAVMQPDQRRHLGAHYTSEKNILKVIKSLFLDELRREFEQAKGNKNRLDALHRRMATMQFLDPACGCGNFLIITYRELRLLELDILRELHKNQLVTNVDNIIQIDVNQFYGIEYDEFACQIAQVAMWLIDHQCNMLVSNAFGEYFVRLPLRKSATIVHGNALRIDWQTIVAAADLTYILGNPPFVGKSLQTAAQKEDLDRVFDRVSGAGVLDYVAAWYLRAAQYIQNTNIKVAFVSTNSIAQGEQVGILWGELFVHYHIKIHFAHRTFSWSNEARGNAAVHCVIVGFANYDTTEKSIYDYPDIKGEPVERKARNINPYLTEGSDLFIRKQTKPLIPVPEMIKGSQPTDGGHLLLSDDEKNELLRVEPAAAEWVRPFIGAREFLNNEKRWCLWLVGIQPQQLKKMPHVWARVENVKKMRLASSKIPTQKWADFPTLFTENRQPISDYIIVPRHSSENRKYIPLGFLNCDSIVADSCNCIPNADLYLFGVLTSEMHMTWVRYVCGRLKSDFRYSNTIVYNNYPFPRDVSDANRQKVIAAAQRVLDVRAAYPASSLADLYDALAMPPDLVKAHQALDKAVDVCYRPQPFTNELNRIEFLFQQYEQLTYTLFATPKKKRK